MSNKSKTDKATVQGLVPKLRFPEFRNAGEWEEKPLGKVATVTMGTSPKSSNYNSQSIGLPLIQGNADIKNRRSFPRIYTSEITKECFPEDILMSVRAPVGEIAQSCHHACIGRGIAAINSNETYIQKFIYQFLLWFETKWKRFSQGSTFESVNFKDVKYLNIYVPSPEEQQKIADCLSSLDELITAQGQKIETLKAHKKGLMQQLFPAEGETVPKRRFPEFRNAGAWEEKPLGKVALFSKGKGISKSDVTKDGKQPCIRYGELYTLYNETIENVSSFTNTSAKNLVLSKANDVIIPASGETQEDIATASCVINSNIALGGDLNIIRSKMNGVFLTYYLNSAKKKSIALLSQGISVVHLYSSQLKKLDINIPDRPEQQKIADCLSSLDDLITSQTQKLDTLKAHKKGLIQQLFPSADEANG